MDRYASILSIDAQAYAHIHVERQLLKDIHFSIRQKNIANSIRCCNGRVAPGSQPHRFTKHGYRAENPSPKYHSQTLCSRRSAMLIEIQKMAGFVSRITKVGGRLFWKKICLWAVTSNKKSAPMLHTHPFFIPLATVPTGQTEHLKYRYFKSV